MFAIFSWASAASGILGKKVSKSLYSISAWVNASTTFGIPRVSHRQLGTGDVLGVRIGVDQRLQGHAGNVEAIVLHCVHGTVEKDLVWLLGTDIRQRVTHFFISA